jgi:hypothetical protein
MGLGIAVPSLWPVALSCLLCLVGQAAGDATDDIRKDDAHKPYDPYDAYGDSESDDFLNDFGYGTDSLDEYAGYGQDSLFYYSDEFDVYYNTYGIYADEYGDDYFDSNKTADTECKQDKSGKVSLKGVNIIRFHDRGKPYTVWRPRLGELNGEVLLCRGSV